MPPFPINLSSLLHGRSVEWERLEFKRSWNPSDVLHTVCAFANDFHNLGGGYVVIGIEEKDGRPLFPAVGVQPEEIDAIQKELLKLGHNAIQPAYHPILTSYDWECKTILVIWCPGGQVRPYKAKVALGKDCREYPIFSAKVLRPSGLAAPTKPSSCRWRQRFPSTTEPTSEPGSTICHAT